MTFSLEEVLLESYVVLVNETSFLRTLMKLNDATEDKLLLRFVETSTGSGR